MGGRWLLIPCILSLFDNEEQAGPAEDSQDEAPEVRHSRPCEKQGLVERWGSKALVSLDRE